MSKKSKQKFLKQQLIQTKREIFKTFGNIFDIFYKVTIGIIASQKKVEFWFPILFFSVATFYYFTGSHLEGHITYSDMDFGFQREYLFRIFPLWNFEWSTPNFFNATRIYFLAPLALLAELFQISGSSWEKLIIFSLLWSSGYFMYLLLTKIFTEDFKVERIKTPRIFIIFSALLGGLFYAFNPWVIIRIQHIYLLVGHALLPLIFLFTTQLTENFSDISKEKKQKKKRTKKSLKQLFQHFFEIRSKTIKKIKSRKKIILSIIGLSFFWAASVGAIHYLFFSFFLIFSWVSFRLIRYLFQKHWKNASILFIRFFLAGFLTMGLLAYFLIPYISASLIGSVNPPNINSIDSIDMVSRNNLPSLILYLISYWWGLFDFHTLPMSFWFSGGILFSIMALGILLKLHNKFVLFFTLWCLGMFGMSFGTKWNADIFRWLVFEGPFASSVGFIFRDGNKFVGLLSFGMAILLGYGLSSLFEELSRLWKERQKFCKTLPWTLTNSNYFTLIIFAFCVGTIFSLNQYFKPIHKLYFHHLYRPTPIPESYVKAHDFLNQTKSEKLNRTYMLPRYEMMVSKPFGYAVSSWNAFRREGLPPKATSTMDIWSLGQRTYHPQEGSTVFWHTLSHFFFDEMLGQNRSENIGRMIRTLGVDRFVFHSDIQGFEKKSETAVKLLKKSDDISLFEKGHIGFFDIFKIENPLPWAHIFSRNLLSFSGFSLLDGLFNFPYFDESETALFFGSQSTKGFDLNNLNEGDVLETKTKLDALLSQTEDKYLQIPFEATLFGQPNYRWAKLRTDTPDWNWQLRSMGIKNEKHEFDLGKGIAYTVVPKKIDVLPYENFKEVGKPFNFQNHLKNDEQIFSSEIPEQLTIQEGFSNEYDDMPSVFGKIEKGNTQFFRIAKSKKFPAKPKNGYFFEMVMSGRNAHLIHAKVKFFDAAEEEVGIAYVSAPSEVETFDFLKFKGLYVTPPETEKFQIEILSLEKPKVKSFWYLHNFTMLDLQDSMKPNTLEMNFVPESTESYFIFSRDFHNIKGGRISLKIGDNEPKLISTKTQFENKFEWKSLGKISLKKDQNVLVQLQNLEGFNASNAIAIIPESKYKIYQKNFENQIQKISPLILLEADTAFEKSGHKQSNETNSLFTNGKAIRLNSGFLRTNFSILKSTRYKISARTELFETNNFQEITVNILNEKGKTIYEKNINLGESKISQKSKKTLHWVNLPDQFLEKGKYQIIISFMDKSPSLIHFKDFKKWDASDFRFKTPEINIKNTDCSKYVKTDDSQFRITKTNDLMRVKIKKSVSCNWQIAVSKPIRVKENENYLLKFEISGENVNQLHSKINFFDRHNRFISTQQLTFPKDENFPFYEIEEIITVPEKAVQMHIQMLSRPHPQFDGKFEIKQFLLKNYETLPMLDLFALYEKWSPKRIAPKVNKITKNYLDYDLEISPTISGKTENFSLQFGESFTPLWQLKDGNEKINSVPVFLALQSFNIEVGKNSKIVKYDFRPKKAFFWGCGISGFLLILMGITFWIMPPKK